MNARERFDATLHYEERDRCPMMDFGFWRETLPLWNDQGYPADADPDDFFGMDPQWIICETHNGLWPEFERVVIEDRGDTEVIRQPDGVVVERGKVLGSIPRHLDHLLKDRASWEEHYLPRLQPDEPTRLPDPEAWEKSVAEWKDPDRDYPLFIKAGSLYGKARNWFGLERISEIIYDDPALFEQVVETLADTMIATLHRALSAGFRPEAGVMWEDMCYNSGPLISPKLFERVLVPRYRRIAETLRSYGVDILMLDCDGCIDRLLPMWLDAGVNMLYPIEVGTWKADPIAYRKQYGKSLRMMGGVDKNILARPTEEIDREIERLAPLVEEGGFIPTCDHRVPPNVPFENYVHYMKKAREVWGRGAPSLRPMGNTDARA